MEAPGGDKELGREHSATKTSGDEPVEWHQTVSGASEMDKETLFSFGNGVNNMETELQYNTSTPVFSHAQETSAVQVSSGTSNIAFQGEMMSTPTQASSNLSSGSHPRLLQFSTGDMTKLDALKPLHETSSRECSRVDPDTSIAESSTFYTAGADESAAYFTASEDSTFVIDNDQTGDLPSRRSGQGFPEVHTTGELEEQQSSLNENVEAQDIALKSFAGPEHDNSEGWVAGRSVDVRLQRSDESQLFESEQGLSLPKGAAENHKDLPGADGHLPARDDDDVKESYDLKTSESIPEEVSDRDNLDLKILETICEEATNMTIKEALIHSLNPSVRAGLQDGKLLLNETEVLSLERYCETVIDNLITELLERTWSQGSESFDHFGIEEKKERALQLSEVGLKALQKSCGRLAQDIISESIEDTNSLPREVTLKGRVKTCQGSMPTATMQELLVLFQSSADIQHYIGDLTASVINSAMSKVAISTTSGFINNEMRSVNGDSITDEDAELARISGKHSLDDQNTTQRFYHGAEDLAEGDELQDLDSESSETSDSSRDCDGFGLSLGTGELVVGATLEYDAEWDRGDMLNELHSFAPVGKQKIIVRELSFEEQTDVARIDLLAPVFLAVTEDSDEDSDLKGLRRKAQSIENLCTVVEERVAPIRRCRSSSIPTSRKATRKLQRKKEEDERVNQDSDTEKQDEITGAEGESERGTVWVSDGQEEPPSAAEESKVDLRWYTVSVNSRNKVLDLNMLAPYMKVISHGGRFTGDRSTIVVIAACYLPQRSNKNYDYLMEQLFFYVISTLELLATDEEYYLVYFNAGTAQKRPTMAWMRRFYQQIERGLRKRMRAMYVVHPNFWLKTVTTFAKPFISSNFWRKLHFVHTLDSLSSFVPVEYIFIPDEVMRTDPDYRRVHNL